MNELSKKLQLPGLWTGCGRVLIIIAQPSPLVEKSMKKEKKFKNLKKASCSGLIAIIMHDCILMPGGAVFLAMHTLKN